MSEAKVKRIGLLVGRDWSWPSAFISEVGRRDENVVAEFVKLGGTLMNEPCPYQAIVDRMSHEIPYYRSYLKYAALKGAYVINDPFIQAADDKFFGIALVNRLGLRSPRTVALPNKRVEAETAPESYRNLVYPMNWQAIIEFVGVPAILKDAHTGGRRIVHRVHSVDELIQRYDESDTLNVVLQQLMESDVHIHAFVVGREQVLLARYSQPDRRYVADDDFLQNQITPELREQLTADALTISRAYGYDVNMVEFILKDNLLYVINPTNPAPDLDINLLSPRNFNWCVERMAAFAIEMAKRPRPQFAGYQWQRVTAASPPS
ncbi:MAG: hypothetical protein AB1791_18930 [Chloroflexota bacterium]